MSSEAPAMPQVQSPVRQWTRDAAIDFFRGLGLWMIFLDHLDYNVWSNLSLWRIGFSDFAEVFVFLSGFMSVGSWEKVFARGRVPAVIEKLVRRIGRLYIAQVSALLVSLALLWALAERGVRVPDPAMYLWMSNPAQYLIRVLALLYTPGIFTLLLLYIMVAPLLPLMVLGLSRAPKLTLSISAALWFLVQLPPFHSIGLNWRWYFNPLAWQFLFALGAAIRYYSDRLGPIARSRGVVVAAACIVAASAALKCLTQFDWTVRHAGKPDLAWYRLLHFLALVILVYAWMPRNRRWLESPIARWAVACGRKSLPVFATSLVLDTAGNLILAAAPRGALVQLAMSASGILVLCLVANQSRKSME
jgi:hypothetical protein